MIRIIRKIPRNVTIAFSGGIDSVVFTEFLLKGKRKINLAFLTILFEEMWKFIFIAIQTH